MRPTKADTAWVGAGALVSGLGGFGFTWIVARGAGATGAGVVLTLTTWFTLLLSVCKVGMDTTLVREGGRLRARGPGAGLTMLVRWAVVPAVVLSAAVGVALAIAAPWLADLILPDSPVNLSPLIILGGVALPAAVYTIVQLALLRGLGDVRAYVGVEQLGKPAVRALGALLLAAMAVTAPQPYFFVWLVPVLIGGAVTLWLSRSLRHTAGPGQRDPIERRRIWAYAAPRAVSQVVDITNVSLGTIILGAVAGASAAGQFSTALRIVVAGQLAFQAVRLLLAPSLAALLSAGRLRDVQEVFSSGAAVIVLVSWPLFLACVIFPGEILLLFGAEFVAAAQALRILAVSGLLLAIIGTQGAVVLMSGRSRQGLAAASAGLGANFLITFAMAPTLGPTAAALGWTTSVAIEGILLARILRSVGITPFPREAGHAAALTACTVGLALLVLAHLWSWQPAVCALIAAVLIGLWLVTAGRMGRRELSRLTAQAPAVVA